MIADDAARSWSLRRAAACCACFLLVSSSTRALWSQSSGDQVEARRHFDQGVKLTDNGDLHGAIHEFERAFAIAPHPRVLLNLGQTYAAAGMPVEAVDRLEKYLKSNPGDGEKRGHVERQVTIYRQRIGRIRLSIEPPGTEVVIDGQPRGVAPFSEPLELAAGVHGLTARAPGFGPELVTVTVRPKEQTDVKLVLKALATAVPASVGLLRARCRVPDVSLIIDGAEHRMAASESPFILPTGAHWAEFRRPGYASAGESIVIRRDASTKLDCRLRPYSVLSADLLAQPKIVVSQKDARIFMDGVPYAGGPVPAGKHQVEVERAGFLTWSRTVRFLPGQRQALRVHLEPSHELDAYRRERAELYRTVGVIAGAAGVGLVGAGVAVGVDASKRYSDWKRDSEANNEALARGSASDEALETSARLRSEAASIQRQTDIGIGLGIAGGVFILSGASLWLVSMRSEKGPRVTATGRGVALGFRF